MVTESLVETIKRELPGLLREDPELRRYVVELTRNLYADRAETAGRFDRLLDELRRDREAQARKWDEQNRKWDEQNRKWDEQNRKWDENTAELGRRWQENAAERERRWQENAAERERRWQENAAERERRWEENKREFDRVHEEIMAQAKKVDRSIGALGSRWGLQSEAAFRNALAGILEEGFGVTVANVSEFDDQGEVFGRPDQVELDIIVKNGMLLILELKSSVDKAGMYIFERKARFYEKRHQRQASRLIVISPMIEPKAQAVARKLGIETYTDSADVPAE